MWMALFAIFSTVSFVACSDDDDEVDPTQGGSESAILNYAKYQAAVNETVKKTHDDTQHDKVILLVAFGSTWQQAYNAFDATVEEYKKRFPDYDVFLSFSSAICINRAAAGENVAPRNFYAPNFWLTAFAQPGVQYGEIVVQSLQVIPGEEYTRVINYMKDFQNNSNGDLDDDYLRNTPVRLGVPLMASAKNDVPLLASILDEYYHDKVQGDGFVLFMGHGNPDAYDTYKANERYTQLEEALQANHSTHYYVGTVDMMDNFKTHVHTRIMVRDGFSSGTIYLHPLMSIAGDHAHNDMADNENEAWSIEHNSYNTNDEGEAEDTSWKMYFQTMGYTCDDNTVIMKGLLELPKVRDMWIQHTIDAKPFDYYHSMHPEE